MILPHFRSSIPGKPLSYATPAQCARQLKQACARLPISCVLLGWKLSPAIEEAVADEAAHQNAKLFRWQPLLTVESPSEVLPAWHTQNLFGKPIQGYGGLPEFTFLCPNHSLVADYLSEKVEYLASSGLFQGLFLDRIRFPSPSLDPLHELGCFCVHCTNLAENAGLDLDSVRHEIQSLPAAQIVRSFLGRNQSEGLSPGILPGFSGCLYHPYHKDNIKTGNVS